MRNALLVDGRRDPILADVHIDDGYISGIEPVGSSAGEASTVIDASGAPTLPGLVNSHLHSNEFLMKGRVFGFPLEPYILQTWARFDEADILTPELVYACTMVNCAEMLMGGVTGAVDDYTPVRFRDEYIDAVVAGYADSGMRADISIRDDGPPAP